MWNFYTSNEIKPKGWLKTQLEIQAKGLSGNLDKVWKDVRDSSWIGGNAEGWERVPYWLDGFVPLAYLLEDGDMIARAKKYIDAILANQKEDGWICPCTEEQRDSYDTWAVLLITKVLVIYYQCSKDERIPEVIYNTLKNYYELLESGKISLFEWGKFRWYEGFIAINFVYERYKEGWLLELAKILREQGQNYRELTHLWERPLNMWRFETHIVNIAMCLKYEAVSCRLLGEEYEDRAEELISVLSKYNGTPMGLFTGDECLSGVSPIQGTELCAVAEQMYSYELLFARTGDKKWAERLAVLAFNALPATVSDDMWSHQYVQQSNQIACIKFPGKPVFRTNGPDSHLFGLEPNYGCCTANFGQAWPKFALSLFMHNGNKVINIHPVASKLNDSKCEIEVISNYPFENNIKYIVKAKEDFEFTVNLPESAENIIISGKEANDFSFFFKAGEEKEIEISFETEIKLEKANSGMYYAKKGPLIFSVPISYEKKMLEYEKDGVERKFPYCDYEYIPESNWEYAYVSLGKAEFKGVGEIPFSSEKPPVTVKATCAPISWGYEDGYETVCAKYPADTTPTGENKEIELYPYGCAKLRITEAPLIK